MVTHQREMARVIINLISSAAIDMSVRMFLNILLLSVDGYKLILQSY